MSKRRPTFDEFSIIIGVLLAVLASALTLISLIFYLGAKSDYSEVCFPSGVYAAYPRCVSDLNNMTLFGILAVIGFPFMALGLYVNRRVQPIFYFSVSVTLMLGFFALYLYL